MTELEVARRPGMIHEMGGSLASRWLALVACSALAARVAGAIVLSFPAEGMRLVDLAGEQWGVAWSAEEVVLTGSVDLSGDSFGGTVRIEARGVAVHDESFRRAAEGMRIVGSLSVEELSATGGRGRIDLLLPGGEMLWDRFYVDLATYPAAVSGDWQIDGSGGARFSNAEVAVAGVGKARGGGSLRTNGEASLAGEIDVPGLSHLYALLIGNPFGERRPRVGSTQVSGRMSGDLRYRRSPGGEHEISGDLRIRDAAVFGAGPGFQIGGFDADLPLRLGSLAEKGAARRGSIRVRGCTVQGIDLGPLEVPLRVGADSLELAGLLQIPVLGGALTVHRLSATELSSSASRRIAIAFDVDAIDLSRLAINLGLPRLEGRLSGGIPEIEIVGGKLRSQGEMVAHVFGGRLRARNLHGSGLRSPIPSFGFDLDYEDISLAELTRAFSFGYVSGVARGKIRDLEIVSWGPVAFDAHLESDASSGVRQRLSVEAIRQLSILGGGTSDPFTVSVLGLFDEYGYSKLGFRCRLRNDVFELDGMEVSGDRHYLVKGSAMPPSVNVVSHNRTISFSEMVEYIERLWGG